MIRAFLFCLWIVCATQVVVSSSSSSSSPSPSSNSSSPPTDISKELQPYIVYPNDIQVDFSRMIGTGKYAKCYLANWKGKKVVVKRLHHRVGWSRRETTNSEIINEAICMKKFTSKHILPLTGVTWDDEKRVMLITPFQEHGTLDTLVPKLVKRQERVRGIKWILQVLEGLHYMHNMGYAHNDILGKNIFVHGLRYETVLADVGMTSALTPKTKQQDIAAVMDLVETLELFTTEKEPFRQLFIDIARECKLPELVEARPNFCSIERLKRRFYRLRKQNSRTLEADTTEE